MRPEGISPPLILSLIADVPTDDAVADGLETIDCDPMLRAIADAGNRSIVVVIDHPGGSALAAFSMYNALRLHPYRVSASIIQKCSSSAPIIALAADRRTIASDATVFVHEPAIFLSPQNAAALRKSRNECERLAAAITKVRAELIRIMARRTGADVATVDGWLKDERRFGATEALAAGFVHAIDNAITGTREERIRAAINHVEPAYAG